MYFQGSECICERHCLWCFCTISGTTRRRVGNPELYVFLVNSSKWAEPHAPNPASANQYFPVASLARNPSLPQLNLFCEERFFGTKLFFIVTRVTLEPAKYHVFLLLKAKTNSMDKDNFCSSFSETGPVQRVELT